MTQAKILSAIAHYEHACGISKLMPEIKEFAEFYLRELPEAQRKLIVKYAKAKKAAAASLCAEWERQYPELKGQA